MSSIKATENDQFGHHKHYADLHLLVEGHEYSSYGSRIKDEAVAFDEASDIGFVRCHEKYPLLLGYHNLRFSSENHTNQMVIQVWKKKFANISLKFLID